MATVMGRGRSEPCRTEAGTVPDCRDRAREIYHIRHHSLFMPRDFDVSPCFSVIKPTLMHTVDYRTLTWGKVD